VNFATPLWETGRRSPEIVDTLRHHEVVADRIAAHEPNVVRIPVRARLIDRGGLSSKCVIIRRPIDENLSGRIGDFE